MGGTLSDRCLNEWVDGSMLSVTAGKPQGPQGPGTLRSWLWACNVSSQPLVSLHPSSHSLPPFPSLLPFPAIRPLALRWWLELVQSSTFRPWRLHLQTSWSTLWVRQGHVTTLTNQLRAEMMCVMSMWDHEEPACDLQLVTVKVRV